jgi:phosphohistidine swiveling domain-containing protein
MSFDDWDPLHNHSTDDLFWTMTNAGEAMPGVQTPLSISAWKDLATVGFQKAGEAFGVFTPEDGMPCLGLEIFYGRGAMSVTFLGVLGDRAPGTTGEQAVKGLVGYVPEGMTFSPTKRFYLNVLRRYPRTFLTVPRRLRDLSERQDEWWRRRILGLGQLDERETRRLLDEAFERHTEATITQCIAVFNAVQPVHDAVEQLIDRLGTGDKSKLTAPVGGAEMEVVADIWRASRGQLSVDDVVARHGFHGPVEGEISSRVWRDDDTPLRRLIDQYARRPDVGSPLAADAERIRERERAERELLAAAPLRMKPAVRLVLSLARKRLHLRGVAKRSMLQGFDGVRASARRLGELLAADGAFDDPEDVFYLTTDEIRRPLPRDVKDLVGRRRERRTDYSRYTLPTNFAGVPTPIPIDQAEPEPGSDRSVVEGIGVSAGVAEGSARVVTDPGFADVEEDEILIAPTTDPSWSSIMFISSALVVDIGGTLSHAAVVARELGIPCVVNTRHGTRAIRTGDRVRVDGGEGTVTILERAEGAEAWTGT